MPAQLPIPCETTLLRFGSTSVRLLLPDATALNARYLNGPPAAPYWARLWPASIGLCEYLTQRPDLIAGKRVLELAGGLGLPGLLAAHHAAEVTLSDIDPDAVRVMAAAIELNGFPNARSRTVDWTAIPDELQPEIVLLSDVNYDPDAFDTLFRVLTGLLDSGITILLSTPQRLMAKPFIARLLPWRSEQHEIQVERGFVSILQLRRSEAGA